MRTLFGAAIVGCAMMIPQVAPAAPPTVDDAVIRDAFGSRARVVREPLSGALRSLSGVRVETVGASPAERALSFAMSAREALAVGDAELVVEETTALPGAGTVVRIAQRVYGLAVEGRSLAVRLGADGAVRGVTSDLVPFEVAIPQRPITPSAARDAVERHFAVGHTGIPTQVVLVSAPGVARVAWRVPAVLIPLVAHFTVWVDAEDGSILRSAPAGRDMPVTRLPIRAEVSR